MNVLIALCRTSSEHRALLKYISMPAFSGCHGYRPRFIVWIQSSGRSAQGHEAWHRQYELWGAFVILFLFFSLSHSSRNVKIWHEQDLLALGERIGSVSTGLSDGLISKCLTESIYCSSDLFQDDGTCVICLVSILDVIQTFVFVFNHDVPNQSHSRFLLPNYKKTCHISAKHM